MQEIVELAKVSPTKLPALNLKDPINAYMTTIQRPSFTTSVVFISEDEIAQSASSGNIVITDVKNASVNNFLKGHTNSINKILFDKKNKRLISTSEDKTIRIWDLVKLECSQILHSSGRVNSVVQYDNQIVAAFDYGKIEILNLETGKKSQPIDAHQGGWRADVMDYPDTNKFISHSHEIMKIWNKSTLKCEGSYQFKNSIQSIVILPDASLFVAEDYGSFTHLSKNLEKINEFKIEGSVCDMHLHSNGTLLLFFRCGKFQERTVDKFELVSEWKVFPTYSNFVRMCVNDENGQVVFATDDKVVTSKFSILNPNVENKNQDIILKIKENLNLIFLNSFTRNTGWQFSSKDDFFWIRGNKNLLAVLRKELNASELANKYEVKETIASEDKSIIIKINETLTLTDLANILVTRWKDILNPEKTSNYAYII